MTKPPFLDGEKLPFMCWGVTLWLIPVFLEQILPRSEAASSFIWCFLWTNASNPAQSKTCVWWPRLKMLAMKALPFPLFQPVSRSILLYARDGAKRTKRGYEDVSKYSETQHVHGSPRRTMDSASQLLSQVNQPCQFVRPWTCWFSEFLDTSSYFAGFHGSFSQAVVCCVLYSVLMFKMSEWTPGACRLSNDTVLFVPCCQKGNYSWLCLEKWVADFNVLPNRDTSLEHIFPIAGQRNMKGSTLHSLWELIDRLRMETLELNLGPAHQFPPRFARPQFTPARSVSMHADQCLWVRVKVSEWSQNLKTRLFSTAVRSNKQTILCCQHRCERCAALAFCFFKVVPIVSHHSRRRLWGGFRVNYWEANLRRDSAPSDPPGSSSVRR